MMVKGKPGQTFVRSTVSVVALCAAVAVVAPMDFASDSAGAAFAQQNQGGQSGAGGGNAGERDGQGQRQGGSGQGGEGAGQGQQGTGGGSGAGGGGAGQHDSGSDDHDEGGDEHAPGEGAGRGGDSAGQGQQGSGSSDDRGGSGQGQRGQGDVTAEDAPDGVGGGRDNAGGGGGQGTPGGGSRGGGRPDEDLGDLFGDTYVILRDDNGVPILTDDGYVQPLDIFGNTIALNEEGEPVDEAAVVEVDLGRLNLGRSPDDVLDARLEEVIGLLNEVDSEGESITTDPAGRLLVTYEDTVTVLDEEGYPVLDDDGNVVQETVIIAKTIDSPLENLAIYEALLTDGALLSENTALSAEAIAALPTSLAGLADASVDAGDTDNIDDGDLSIAMTFLAAATDKTGTFSTDEIAYINTILGINLTEFADDEGEGTGIYYSDIDYSDVVYDRSVFDLETTVLVQTEPGVWVETPVNIYTTVFDGEAYVVAPEDVATLADWTQAADDAREVIEFIHEYAIPADSTTE